MGPKKTLHLYRSNYTLFDQVGTQSIVCTSGLICYDKTFMYVG